MKFAQQNLPTWFWDNLKTSGVLSTKEQINPILESHKKLRIITMCSIHNGGHISVCAVKRNSRQMGQIGGTKTRLPRVPSNYSEETKHPNLSAGFAAIKNSP